MRAIGQTFRPEFQNRLDKVIVFHPLTRDLMRGILAKELNRVLERRGLKDREWAVEWEASAQDFLLEKGFSPEMGARPLKRAIEQYVIAPLAATIVEKRFPEGDQFVFIRSDGRAIQAEFVDPDGDSPAAMQTSGTPPGLPGMILAPEGTAAEVQVLEGEHAGIAEALATAEWEDLKHSLSQEMAAPGFWARPDRHATLARLALMDRVKAAMSTADALRGRLAKGTERSGRSSRELVARLALQLHLIKEGVRDVHEREPDRGRAAGRAGAGARRRPRSDAGRGARACWRCTAPGPATGTCNFRKSPAQLRGACRCSSSAVSARIANSSARRDCMCWRGRRQGPRAGDGARAAGRGAARRFVRGQAAAGAYRRAAKRCAAARGRATLSQRSVARWCAT